MKRFVAVSSVADLFVQKKSVRARARRSTLGHFRRRLSQIVRLLHNERRRIQRFSWPTLLALQRDFLWSERARARTRTRIAVRRSVLFWALWFSRARGSLTPLWPLTARLAVPGRRPRETAAAASRSPTCRRSFTRAANPVAPRTLSRRRGAKYGERHFHPYAINGANCPQDPIVIQDSNMDQNVFSVWVKSLKFQTLAIEALNLFKTILWQKVKLTVQIFVLN